MSDRVALRAGRRPSRMPSAGAFTLVEMVVSLTIVAVIAAASVSLVMVVAAALRNEAANVGADATTARSATSAIVDDLRVATALTEQTATAVTMTVPDRDGDGVAETIRYAWSGTPGDPITRSYNGVVGTLAENVRAANFSFLTKTVGRPPPVEGAEAAIASHDAAVPANQVGYQLTNVKGAAGYLKPAPPAKAVAWKLTRCRVLLQRNGGSVGTVTVSVKYADGNKLPTGAALCSGSVLIANVLSTGPAPMDVTFDAPASLDPSKGICLVVSYTSVSGSGGYVFADTANADAALAFTTTGDAGATWAAAAPASAMVFAAWGTVSTQERETLDFQPLPPSAP